MINGEEMAFDCRYVDNNNRYLDSICVRIMAMGLKCDLFLCISTGPPSIMMINYGPGGSGLDSSVDRCLHFYFEDVSSRGHFCFIRQLVPFPDGTREERVFVCVCCGANGLKVV